MFEVSEYLVIELILLDLLVLSFDDNDPLRKKNPKLISMARDCLLIFFNTNAYS